MNHVDCEHLRENESWRQVLAAYVAEQDVCKAITPEHDGWVSRLKSICDVPAEDLAHIHGRLIAHGYLKFQLAGRTEGLQYQVSSFGRESLKGCADSAASTDDERAPFNQEAA